MGERAPRAAAPAMALLDAAADTRVGLGQAPLQHFEIADDHGEQVVEVVRDAAGQLADRFHFLRVTQLLLDPLPVRSGGLEALVGGREVARAPGDALLQGRVQPAKRVLGLALRRAVAQDLEEADRRASVVPQGQQRAARPEPGAVLAHVPALVRGAAFGERELHLGLGCAGLAILGRVDQAPVLAERFSLAPAEQVTSARVPTRDLPVQVGRDDGVVRGALNNLPMARFALAQRPFALAQPGRGRCEGDADPVRLGQRGRERRDGLAAPERRGLTREGLDRRRDAPSHAEREPRRQCPERRAKAGEQPQRPAQRRIQLVLAHPDRDAPIREPGAGIGAEYREPVEGEPAPAAFLAACVVEEVFCGLLADELLVTPIPGQDGSTAVNDRSRPTRRQVLRRDHVADHFDRD